MSMMWLEVVVVVVVVVTPNDNQYHNDTIATNDISNAYKLKQKDVRMCGCVCVLILMVITSPLPMKDMAKEQKRPPKRTLI